MGKKNSLAAIEPWLFSVLMLLSLAPVFFFRWFPSLYGPVHLYDAQVFTALIHGDSVIGSLYGINWFGSGITVQVLLSLFNLIFPAWLAEKILLALLVCLLPLSFRYLISGIQKKNGLMHLLVFPLSWSFLIMLGDYHFCSGVIIGIWILGWVLKKNEDGLKNLLLLCLLFILLLYTSLSAWVIFIPVFIVIRFFRHREEGKVNSFFKTGRDILALLPAVIIFILMITAFGGETTPVRYVSFMDHLKWLAVSRPLIVYSWNTEWPLAVLFTLSLLVPASWIIIQKIQKNSVIHAEPSFFFAGIFILVLYFVIPDVWDGIGENLQIKLLILFYLIFICRIALLKFPGIIQISAFALAFISMTALAVFHLQQQQPLQRSVKAIERVAQQIPPGTVVYPVNCSDNWLQKYLPAYLGADKNIPVLFRHPAYTEGVVSMKPATEKELARYGNADPALFNNADLIAQIDAIVFWMGEDIPVRYPAFASPMLQSYAPIDSSGSDYPSIYIRKDAFPLKNWKHETELSLKRYFNTTGKTLLDSEYLDMLRIPGEEIPVGELEWIETRAVMTPAVADSGDSVYLVIMTERDGKELDHVMVGTGADSTSLAAGIYMKYRLSEPLEKKDLVKLYLWNPDSVQAVLGKTLFRVHYFK